MSEGRPGKNDRRNVLELVGLPYEAIQNNVKPARMRTRDVNNLEDAGLTLQPADIAGDLLDVGRSDSVDLRHIAELPMVGFDAGGGGTLKRRVSVMVGLINLMNERRTLLCPSALWTMAGRTIRVKFGFSRLQFRWNRGSSDGGFGLR